MEMDKVIKEVMNESASRYRLQDFLSIPAPDKVYRNAFLRDKDGNPIDLKPGEQKPEGSFKVDFALSGQTKLAETMEDFQVIYDKWLKEEFPSGNENHQLLKTTLEDHVNKLIQLHLDNTDLEDKTKKRNTGLISVAQNFIQYLNGKSTEQPIEKPTKIFPDFFPADYKYLPGLLKDEFKTEIGRDVAFIIYVLEKLEIFNVGTRDLKGIHTAMQDYFGRDIGTRESVRKFWVRKDEFNKLYPEDIKSIENKIKALIKQGKSKE